MAKSLDFSSKGRFQAPTWWLTTIRYSRLPTVWVKRSGPSTSQGQRGIMNHESSVRMSCKIICLCIPRQVKCLCQRDEDWSGGPKAWYTRL